MNRTWIKIISVIIVFSISIGLIGSNITAEERNINKSDVFADLAFPTAEGYGRFANGFRGGKVVKVTNLNAEGEGSLRWALEEVSGPRIVVFEVGGVINLDETELQTPIIIKDGNLYIAGQTAPGDGITIIGDGINITDGDVVVRHLRIRSGDSTWFNSGMRLYYGKENIIIDHCSLSWAECSSIKISNNQKVTIQNCILAESVGYNGLTGDIDSILRSCSAVELDAKNISFQKNLITNIGNKVWGFSYDYDETIDTAKSNNSNIDIRNNVVYNWYSASSGIASNSVQFVNNYYKKGEKTQNDILFTLNGTGYLSGNKLVDNKDVIIVDYDDENPWKLASEDSFPEGKSETPLFDERVDTLSADESYTYVLENAGANVPKRDYIDTRYINEVKNGTHTYGSGEYLGFISSQNDAEGFPDNTTFKGGEAPLDTDNDGMPDEWELLHGLNPNDYYDACQVYLSDEGYTNIELYINELAGDPVKYSDNPTIQYTPATPEPTATPELPETPEATATPTPEITETPVDTEVIYLLGDVNNDGVVSAYDALVILKHAAKLELLTTESQLRADVEIDSIIDASDALAILKIAAKIK